VLFKRLHPPGAPLSALDFVEQLGLPRGTDEHRGGAPARPYTLLNMVATADGRVTIKGRSGPIGNRADYELFHALRTVADGVMIGAGTLRTERYNRIVDDPDERALRLARGLQEEPCACLLSRHLDLSPEIPLLADPTARVVIITPSRARLMDCAAHVDYIRSAPGQPLDLRAAMSELHERFAIGVLLCEGGPHLNAELFAQGLIDELLLTLSPKLAGTPPGEQLLLMIAGASFDPPLELELISLLESESHLFLRYRVAHS
jgi:riboflavin biosynthesis pyrimidine reductase